jgi:hypothetical protein
VMQGEYIEKYVLLFEKNSGLINFYKKKGWFTCQEMAELPSSFRWL